jgi:hypothetical protein
MASRPLQWEYFILNYLNINMKFVGVSDAPKWFCYKVKLMLEKKILKLNQNNSNENKSGLNH